MIDQSRKQGEIPILKDFYENCLIGLGVNMKGTYKTIAHVVKGMAISCMFFEDKSHTDVDNSVIFQILQTHINTKG